MRKIFSLAGALAIVLTLAGGMEAQAGGRSVNRPRSINARQGRQQNRIFQGVSSGELTRRETLRLEREQFQIARMESRARRDEELTARERARIQKELNEASRHIYRAKHNERDRN